MVVSPDGVGVRSRVHEYGGGAATVSGSTLYYVDQDDQRWYRSDGPGGEPVALTPVAGEAGVSLRYGDGRVTRSGQWLVSVEERVVAGRATHRVVAVRTDASGEVVGLADDSDFVAAPRPSPDGAWLAWVAWDHPSMPWDSSELRVAPLLVDSAGRPALGTAVRLAGGEGCSVGQPHWCGNGALVFVDDRTGWWLPYRVGGDRFGPVGPDGAGLDPPTAEPLAAGSVEFHAPDWVLGQSTIAEVEDGSLVCRMHEGGLDHLVRLVPPGAAADGGGVRGLLFLQTLDQPCVSIAGVAATGHGSVAVLGSTATESQAVFEIPLAGGPPVRCSAAPAVEVDPTEVSAARPFTADTPAGPVPGLFFAPVNRRVDGDAGGLAPLVVFCHGGPTSAAAPGFDPVVQFFTSRGLAVAAVDYRGSTGYGRAYRNRLVGLWGEADIDDCVAYASALADAGLVDGGRMAIRGTSAGGLTALGALIRSDRFAGAAAWYGVTDLEALATDTHEFEARYVDSLIGPWPEAGRHLPGALADPPSRSRHRVGAVAPGLRRPGGAGRPVRALRRPAGAPRCPVPVGGVRRRVPRLPPA